MLLVRFAPAVSHRAENFSEQWLSQSICKTRRNSCSLVRTSLKSRTRETELAKGRGRQAGRSKNKKLVFSFILWQICILRRNMSYCIWNSAIHMDFSREYRFVFWEEIVLQARLLSPEACIISVQKAQKILNPNKRWGYLTLAPVSPEHQTCYHGRKIAA